MKRNEMNLGPTWMLLNFESDPSHHLDTKKYQRSRFSHLLIIGCFALEHDLYMPWWRSALSDCSCVKLLYYSYGHISSI